MTTTLNALVAHHPAEALALGAPDRGWMTYGGLRDLAGRTADALRGFGIGATDRVAIVLPNGPIWRRAPRPRRRLPLRRSTRTTAKTSLRSILMTLAPRRLSLQMAMTAWRRLLAKPGLTILRLHANDSAGFYPSADGDTTAAEAGTPSDDDVALIPHIWHDVAPQDRAPCNQT